MGTSETWDLDKNWCSICGGFKFRPHVCPPCWSVEYVGAEGPTYRAVHAPNPYFAAEAFAKWYDDQHSQFPIAQNGEKLRVKVRSADGQQEQDFVITGQWEPVYYPTEVR